LNFFYGYARANLDQQTYTVPVQQQELQRLWRATVEAEGVQWAGVFSDRATNSAKPLGNRTMGYALQLRLRAGDHVAMTKLDRAFRNVQEAAKQIQLWDDAGIVVHVIDLRLNTKTPAGKVVLGTLAAVAEFGRALRRERGRAVMNTEKIRKKMRTRKERIKCVGRAALGFRLIGAPGRRVCVEDPEERAAMALIVTLRDQERLSWQKIALRLLRERLRQRFLNGNGRSWLPDCCRSAYFAEKELRAQTTAPSLPTPDSASPTEPSPPEPST
jgi:DNA invertase Pin-like site-specific DNA recombinase